MEIGAILAQQNLDILLAIDNEINKKIAELNMESSLIHKAIKFRRLSATTKTNKVGKETKPVAAKKHVLSGVTKRMVADLIYENVEPMSPKEVFANLTGRGFKITYAAVGQHLTALKKSGIIDNPIKGVYQRPFKKEWYFHNEQEESVLI